jgi:prepilin-type N-terminal cleavage/methylation domain-containing protein
MKHRVKAGFTLTELLIALALLGVIAAFTVPKVLSGASANRQNEIVKSVVAQIQAAYANYKLDDIESANTSFANMTPYVNYLSVMTSGAIDNKEGNASGMNCTATLPCLKLHNGAVLRYNAGSSGIFAGTSSTHALEFFIDPDGVDSGLTTGPSKSVNLFLYYDGRIKTRGTLDPGTYASGSSFATPNPAFDPPWFSWN